MDPKVARTDSEDSFSSSRGATSAKSGTKLPFTLDEPLPRIWRLKLDLQGSKVNKLGHEVMDDFNARILPELEKLASKIDALVFVSGKPGNFIAGADIELIQSAKSAKEAEELARSGQILSCRWEDLPFPTIAAINGVALGGGFEMALASSAIVISDDPSARIGLPEVGLGLIPGMGGCVRLPRKIGIAQALGIILRPLSALSGEKAYKAGIAEALIPRQNFEAQALLWAQKNFQAIKSGKRLAKEPKLGDTGGVVGALMENNPLGRKAIYIKAHGDVMKETKGNYPAPLEVLAVLEATGAAYGARLSGSAREKALKREAEGFGKCAATDVSKNLIRIFFLTETVKKSNGLPEGRQAQAHPVRSAGVLGAGVMGGGIAQLFADKNLETRMKDLTPAALQLGTQVASNLWKKLVKKRKITQRQLLQKMNHIAPTLDYSGFHSLDFVVEAIVENMGVKKKVLRELEDSISDTCVVASNTSSLSITEMQSGLKIPERFAGMHFFNPVSKMPLVEVIRGQKSSDEAVSTVFQLAKKLGKTPIVVKDSSGFLVNRLLGPYINEAAWILSEGAPIPEIDKVMVKFGMPMGPMELMDEVGLDVGAKVAHIFEEAFGERMKACPVLAKVIESGRLGKKSLKGIYSYTDEGGGRLKKELDPLIYETMGISPRDGAVSEQEIVDRCVLPMINEAARCLEEGVVATADEVDIGMIFGTGFPPFRGGLLRYADSLGAKEVVEKLKKLQASRGVKFEPSQAMLRRAQNGERFHE